MRLLTLILIYAYLSVCHSSHSDQAGQSPKDAIASEVAWIEQVL